MIRDEKIALRWHRRLRLRLWHRVLTPGWFRPTPAARLRGWARVLDWRDARTPRERLRLMKHAVETPLRAWRQAGSAVGKFGAEVEAVSGVSPDAQRRQIWWLAARHGLNSTSYLDFQLYRPERRRQAGAYMQEREVFRVLPWYSRTALRTDPYPTADKLRFHGWCRSNGLAAVPTLLEYEEGALVNSTLGRDDALPPTDLFSKPSDGTGGHGTARWRYDGDGRWTGGDGRARTDAEFRAEIARISQTLPRKYGRTSRRILVQPCLRNHRDLLPLTPGALSTVRILTYREPGAAARVLLAVYKMPTGDAPADNFHFGGILAPVDVETGRLGSGIRRQGRVLVPVERHPDTGSVIAGHQLPWWAAAKDLARRGLDAAPRRPSLGWDVAITDEGPVLVEGNTVSNPDIAQVPTGTPLSRTPFPAAIESYVQRAMGL